MTSGLNTSKQGTWAARKLASVVVMLMVFVPVCCMLTHVPEPSALLEQPTMLYAAALYRMATGNTAAASSLIERAVSATEHCNQQAPQQPASSKKS